MSYRVLLDEIVEYEVGFRLENYGHDVEHVDFVAEFGKGIEDERIADYSRSADRLILTYDDDFPHEEVHRGVVGEVEVVSGVVNPVAELSY